MADGITLRYASFVAKTKDVAVAKKKPASHRKEWLARDLKILRSAPKHGQSQRDVALLLGRTPAAIQQKAFAEGIAFRRKSR